MSDMLALVMQQLEQQAQASGISANSWNGYATLLRFVEGVLARLPTLHELEGGDIDARFTVELEYLARLVVELFPTGSFEELATFLVPEE